MNLPAPGSAPKKEAGKATPAPQKTGFLGLPPPKNEGGGMVLPPANNGGLGLPPPKASKVEVGSKEPSNIKQHNDDDASH